ncbi:MAG: agmatinase family protein [Planctomycetes bacterium]|nr:agmatinase family protein [Planctomycetota bacterium]
MSAFDPDAAAAGDSGVFGLTTPPQQAAVVLVPVPFAATVSYGGGAEAGPASILAASHQVDLYDWHFGRVYESGICMLPPDPRLAQLHAEARAAAAPLIADGGSAEGGGAVAAIDAAGAEVNALVFAAVDAVLAQGRVAGVVGGDHSVPFGAIQAAARRHPGLGILHFDAHADLRVAYEGFRWSHASIMDNVLRECPGVARLVQVGIRDYGERELRAIQASEGRVLTHFDAEWQRRRFAGESFDAMVDDALAPLPPLVWVSFDIDGLDPALCPNTGTPVPGGLQFAEAAHLLARLAASGRRIVGFDLVEVAPGATGEWDANVGARLLYKLCGAALRSREVAGAGC